MYICLGAVFEIYDSSTKTNDKHWLVKPFVLFEQCCCCLISGQKKTNSIDIDVWIYRVRMSQILPSKHGHIGPILTECRYIGIGLPMSGRYRTDVRLMLILCFAHIIFILTCFCYSRRLIRLLYCYFNCHCQNKNISIHIYRPDIGPISSGFLRLSTSILNVD